MNSITQFLYNILAGINGVVGNYGVAIIIFTILMRMICMPFDYRSRKGMRKMSLIQPKLNELQRKYGNDKQKFQQKQAELMRKEGYNPLSSCLPMLLTWPLMIAMFAAMRAIANEQLAMQVFKYLAGEEQIISAADRFLWVKNIWMTDSPFTAIAPNATALQMLTQDVWQKAYDLVQQDPELLAAVTQNISAEFLDFSTSDAMKQTVEKIIGVLETLPNYSAAVASVPGWTNLSFLLFSVTLYKDYNGLLIFPVLAGVSQLLQTKFNPQMSEQQPQPNGKPNSMSNFMKYFFPILSVFFCLTSNAGFAVYWVTSSCVMWAQSIIITKILEKKDQKKAATVSGEGSVK